MPANLRSLTKSVPCAYARISHVTGLPADAPAIHKTFRNVHGREYGNLIDSGRANKARGGGAFAAGQFSAAAAAGVLNTDAAMSAVLKYVNHPSLKLVPGFYNESLTASLPVARAMRPVLYADNDVDIYLSAFQALDWLCASGLLVNGSVIGYDDFNHGVRASPRSEDDFLEGEARAHIEIKRKWGLVTRLVRRVPRQGGEAGWAFSVGLPPGTRAERQALQVLQVLRRRGEGPVS